MRWNRHYKLKSYISGSLWLVPFFALLAYWVVSRITQGVGGWLLQTGRIDPTASFYGVSVGGRGRCSRRSSRQTFLSWYSPSVRCSSQFKSQAGSTRHGSSQRRCCGTTRSGSPSVISSLPYALT